MKKILMAAALMAGVAFPSFSQKKVLFYIGTGDKSDQSSITLCEMDPANGNIAIIDTVNRCKGPGYVAVSPNKKNLYAVSSDQKISAFAIGADARLTYLNDASSEGVNPCHVSVHPSGKVAFLANYTGGSFSAYPIGADGKLGAASFTEQYTGTGPNTRRQEKAHAHYAQATPDGRFVFVTDLGSDKIMNYAVDAKTGKLSPNPAQAYYMASRGSGPRHFTISSSGKNLYLLNELESTLTSCLVDSKGVITSVETYKTLPADFTGNNTSSAIHLHPNGKFVYVSNRGHNSISAFRILPGGKLEKVDEAKQSINVPRDFNIDPSGRFMIVGNQDSNNLVVYKVDARTGKMTFLKESISTKAPICIAFL